MTVPYALTIGDKHSLDDVLQALKDGHLAVFPTDTVYGLAARADDPAAVASLFNAKGRNAEKKAALLVESPDAMKVVLPAACPRAMTLARRFWPGQLTIVVRFGDETWGFRCPAHPFALMVAKKKDFPLLLTSANKSGDPDPVIFSDIWPSRLMEPPAVVIDGGPTIFRAPSTVVEVEGDVVRLLREGVLASSRIPFLN